MNRYFKHRNFQVHVTRLHVVCSHGTSKEVTDLLDQGANVNIETIQGETPLVFAIKHNADPLEVVQTLISHGAKVNTANKKDHFTPLMFAAKKVW